MIPKDETGQPKLKIAGKYLVIGVQQGENGRFKISVWKLVEFQSSKRIKKFEKVFKNRWNLITMMILVWILS